MKSSFPSHLGIGNSSFLVIVLQAGSDSLAMAEICFLVISLLFRSSFIPPFAIFSAQKAVHVFVGDFFCFCLFGCCFCF